MSSLDMATQCPCNFFMDVSQALLTLEAEETQTSFLLLAQVYLFMLLSVRKYIYISGNIISCIEGSNL